MAGRDTVKVQTQESYRLLGMTGGIICAQGRVAAEHSKVIRKSGSRSSLVVEQIVYDRPATQTRETAVRPLEVQLGKPIV